MMMVNELEDKNTELLVTMMVQTKKRLQAVNIMVKNG